MNDRLTTFLMQLFNSKKEVLSRKTPVKKAKTPKIALFYKDRIVGACFMFVFISSAVVAPHTASASFFSSILGVFVGKNTSASELSEGSSFERYNSQNIPILEANLTPDLRNTISENSQMLLTGQTIEIPEDALFEYDIEEYATTEKIVNYVVKSGDSIEKIAKTLGVSKESVSYAAALKKGQKLQVGQSLAIIPISLPKEAPKTPVSREVATKVETPKKAVVEPKKAEVSPKAVAPIARTAVVEKEIVEEAPAVVASRVVEVEDAKTSEVSSSNKENSAGYIWPFPAGAGRVSQGLHSDQAYDFAAPIGTPIYAVNNGSVLIAKASGYNGGYGKYIVVDFDDGRQAIFAHLNTLKASAGDTVKKGEIIGYVGNTGRSTGPHLHLGFRGPKGNPYVGLKVNAREL
jgi:murein DD-endopeptidase MepM/ murein hydrolase activator NlpD